MRLVLVKKIYLEIETRKFNNIFMVSGSRKLDVFMISGFIIYRCHGNIDFPKIEILTTFSVNPISGENFTLIRLRKVYKKPLKKCIETP